MCAEGLRNLGASLLFLGTDSDTGRGFLTSHRDWCSCSLPSIAQTVSPLIVYSLYSKRSWDLHQQVHQFCICWFLLGLVADKYGIHHIAQQKPVSSAVVGLNPICAVPALVGLYLNEQSFPASTQSKAGSTDVEEHCGPCAASCWLIMSSALHHPVLQVLFYSALLWIFCS